jgi:hypothetical protein
LVKKRPSDVKEKRGVQKVRPALTAAVFFRGRVNAAFRRFDNPGRLGYCMDKLYRVRAEAI